MISWHSVEMTRRSPVLVLGRHPAKSWLEDLSDACSRIDVLKSTVTSHIEIHSCRHWADLIAGKGGYSAYSGVD